MKKWQKDHKIHDNTIAKVNWYGGMMAIFIENFKVLLFYSHIHADDRLNARAKVEVKDLSDIG